MPRVLRVICLGILVLLLQAGGCDDDKPRGSKPRPTSPTTTSSTATDPSTTPSTTPSPTPSPTATSTALSGVAQRTGVVITRNGQPIDAAGLAAIGWTKVDTVNGQANWSDPALGTITVTWEVPDARAICCFDVSFWGEVTGNNLAVGPISMFASVFTFHGTAETSAHSTGGVTAKAPTERVSLEVPHQEVVGTKASVSFDLGFPQPVLVTYTYVYV